MLRKLFKKRKNRFYDMAKEIPSLSDEDLKEWFIVSDSQRVVGDICREELELLKSIELELESRGFSFMKDF